MPGTDKRKQSLYFPEDMLNEIQAKATQSSILMIGVRSRGDDGRHHKLTLTRARIQTERAFPRKRQRERGNSSIAKIGFGLRE